ncbi:MAG: deoxyribodipyrimidine photo-lyase [Gammaproteobacteria bacterium]|jgi:deoxyribodipyrimidine photo-lyase|nr:deoxyribodipyrimidine photo-lyase [Gammaproteobacteria bacterium]
MNTGTRPTLLWLRLDLRLADHAALQAAIERGGPIIPVFIWAPDEEGEWAPGAASRWWLHQSLQRVEESLRKRGSRLIFRIAGHHTGADAADSFSVLQNLVRETGATAIYWSRRYEPLVIARDQSIKSRLRETGLEVRSFNSALLAEPWDIRNLSGKPFQVFTPFWKKTRSVIAPESPIPAPKKIPLPDAWPPSHALSALGLMPKIHWYEGMAESWQPGEAAAMSRFKEFSKDPIEHYSEQRNLPAVPGTSRLSAHLHFGEISPRQIWHGAYAHRDGTFMAEIGWREFAHHLLYHFPHTTNSPLRKEYEDFAWRDSDNDLQAWQRGSTGIRLVDAGMRQLWIEGWMHNRVRMVVASLLVKNLRLHWLHGARWFWDTLVDADLASNTLGWQWAAGCGADAAPYFRVFNPQSQAEKFDPEGRYCQQWNQDRRAPGVPPLAPIVDLKASREAAIAAWKDLRNPTRSS